MSDEFRSEHFAHLILAARVAYHAGAAAKKYDRTMACALHMAHHHQGDEVAYMQAVRGGVKTDIKGDFFLL